MHTTSSTRSTSRIRTALGLLLAAALATSAASAVSAAGARPSGAETVAGTSSAGIAPQLWGGSTVGGNVTCGQVAPGAGLSSSERLEWRGNRYVGDLPEGLTLDDDRRAVTWTSTFPMAAVIVKGGDDAHVYRYGAAPGSPGALGDALLVAPAGPSGQPADVSNVTFCWDPNPPTVDLLALCEAAALEADAGPVVSFLGPIAIRDGVVDAGAPAGALTFDAATDRLSFSVGFPVVAVVTAASLPVVHRIDPPSATGSVPLSSNPGDADVVLCGLDAAVVVASCAQVEADGELGPIRLRGGSADPAELPDGVVDVNASEGAVTFIATVDVVGVVVEASEPQLVVLDEPLFTSAVAVDLDGAEEVLVTLCVLATSGGGTTPVTPPSTDPGVAATQAPGQVEAQGADPTTIPTGGGPSGRTVLLLVAFVLLSLSGSSALLLWSRGG